MKQLGNLAIICAQRKSVQLQVRNGMASVLVDTGTDRAVLSAHWDNDAEIKQIIYELNFGKYRENEKVCASESDDPKSADTLWDLLLRHKNHQVAVVTYGDSDNPADVCLECEDCSEVILDTGLYSLAAKW